MEVFYNVLSWGSPVGLALFLFLSGAGAGIFFWGLSKLAAVDKDKKQE